MAECESLIPSICGGKLVPWFGDEEVHVPDPSVSVSFSITIKRNGQTLTTPPYEPQFADSFSVIATVINDGEVDFAPMIVKAPWFNMESTTDEAPAPSYFMYTFGHVLGDGDVYGDERVFTFEVMGYKENATEPILDDIYTVTYDYATMTKTVTKEQRGQ